MEVNELGLIEYTIEEKLAPIRETLHVLNERSIAINNEMFRLEQEETQLIQERLKPLVGRAFAYKHNHDKVFFVYAVPRMTYTQSGTRSFNPYQIPVLKLNWDSDGWDSKLCPELERDTVYSRCHTSEDALAHFKEEFDEIEIPEFWETVNKELKKFIGEVQREETNRS